MVAPTGIARRALPYAAITAVGMLATDLYLPALPSVARAMGASIEATQATLSWFLGGLALSQLPWGRACDRFGARASLGVGLLAFVAASLGCALVEDVTSLVALRALQGVGAGATTVIVPVLIRRDFGPDEATVAFSWVGIAESLAPGLGPVLGALLLRVADHRAAFLTVAGLALGLGAVVVRASRERSEADRAATPAGRGGLDRRFARYASSHAVALGSLIAFVGSAPHLLAMHLGAGPEGFAWLQLAGVGGFALSASRTAGRLATRGAQWAIRVGAAGQLIGGLAIAAAALAGTHGYALVVAGWVLFCMGMGSRGPVVFAASLEVPGDRVGLASAVLMLACQAFAALATQALAPTLARGPAPTGLTLAACAALAYAVLPTSSQEAAA